MVMMIVIMDYDDHDDDDNDHDHDRSDCLIFDGRYYKDDIDHDFYD